MFLQVAENERLADGDMAYLRHKSPEGGLDTVGFGHKLTMSEHRSGKVHGLLLSELTISDADAILQTDISIHASWVRLNCGTRGYAFDELDERRQEMLIEINFNTGDVCRKFPKFTKAVFAGDEAEMRKQHHRSFTDIDGVRHPLARRNDLFEETYFSDE